LNQLSDQRLVPSDSDFNAVESHRPARTAQWVMSAVGTMLLLALCTWGQIALRDLTGTHRPYTIFYLIPVAIGAALLGVRGGLASAFVAVALARIYLFNDSKHGAQLLLTFPSMAEAIEFCALLAGTVTVATVTGRLRTALGDLRTSGVQIHAANVKLAETNHRLEDTNIRLETANTRLMESEEQRRVFHRDVLMAVTGGKLRLVEAEDMPPQDIVSGAPLLSLPLKDTAGTYL
jgi:hypothetical protein